MLVVSTHSPISMTDFFSFFQLLIKLSWQCFEVSREATNEETFPGRLCNICNVTELPIVWDRTRFHVLRSLLSYDFKRFWCKDFVSEDLCWNHDHSFHWPATTPWTSTFISASTVLETSLRVPLGGWAKVKGIHLPQSKANIKKTIHFVQLITSWCPQLFQDHIFLYPSRTRGPYTQKCSTNVISQSEIGLFLLAFIYTKTMTSLGGWTGVMFFPAPSEVPRRE